MKERQFWSYFHEKQRKMPSSLCNNVYCLFFHCSFPFCWYLNEKLSENLDVVYVYVSAYMFIQISIVERACMSPCTSVRGKILLIILISTASSITNKAFERFIGVN